MSTNFPTSLDSYATVPTNQNTVVKHRDRHQNVEDAIESIEAKLGIDNSADINSIDYKVRNANAFTQLGTGAQTRTLQEKMQRENATVMDYIPLTEHAAIIAGTSTYDTTAAIVNCGTAQTAVVFGPGTYKISSNITINDPVVMLPGAILAPDTGVTVTFTGSFVAGRYKVFGGAGTIVSSSSQRMQVSEIYPEWWGAFPVITSDQAAAMQACIEYARFSNSGFVSLAAGRYRCDTTINVFTGLTIRGAGAMRAVPTGIERWSVLDFSSAADATSGLVVKDVGTAEIYAFHMEAVAVYRNPVATAAGNSKGISLIGVKNFSLKRCHVHGFAINYEFDGNTNGGAICMDGHVEHCISWGNSSEHLRLGGIADTTFDTCNFGSDTGAPTYVVHMIAGTSGNPNAIHFMNCKFIHIGNGTTTRPAAVARIEQGFANRFVNCGFEQSTAQGIRGTMTSSSRTRIEYWFDNCWFNDCGKPVQIDSGDAGYHFKDCRIHSDDAALAEVVQIIGTPGSPVDRDIVFSGCNIHYNGTRGVYVQHAKGVRFVGNRIETSTVNAAIVLDTAATNCIVTDNRHITAFAGTQGVNNLGGGTNVIANNVAGV